MLIEFPEVLEHRLDFGIIWRVFVVAFIIVGWQRHEVGGRRNAALAEVNHSGVHDPKSVLPCYLPPFNLAAAVAGDDTAYFPVADTVQEVITADAYFAYEQLIDIVGAAQFFPLPSFFPFDFSAWSFSILGRLYHARRRFMMSVTACVISFGFAP